MSEIITFLPLWGWVAAFAVTITAGIVKGVTGFAMPLVMVSGLALFLDPRLAVAGIIFPIVVSNTIQALSGGLNGVRDAVAEHWRYLLVVCVMIFLTAQVFAVLPQRAFYFVLGIPVTLLSVIQLIGWRPKMPAGRRRAFEWTIGGFAGMMGGFAGTWGPPTVLYLLALEVPRATSIIVQGVVYGLGSYTLMAGHVVSGILTWETVPFTAILILPAVVGLRLGMRFGQDLDPEKFRRIMLIVLVIAGLNMLRRGFFG